jgi:hypothetical protein
MPYFFVLAFWILCCGLGFLAAFFKQSRFLALYLILGSTVAAIFSALLPAGVLLASEKLLHGSGYGWWGVLALAFSFFGGGALGGILGLLIAKRLNALLGWTKPIAPTSTQ